MNNRPADLLYNDVRRDLIQSAKPVLDIEALGFYVHMVNERYQVRLRKDVQKLPQPWSKDPIFQQFRFTNIRREHDRESLWLINEISTNAKLSYRNKILNSILFRLFNKKETMMIIGAPFDFDNLDKLAIQTRIDRKLYDDPKFVWFTNAFFTSGMRNTINKESVRLGVSEDPRMRIIEKVQRMASGAEGLDPILYAVDTADTQRQVFNALCDHPGIADFLGYQIFVDFTYIPEFKFSENEFTIAGPGCRNGLNVLFKDYDGLNYEEAVFWVRDNIEDVAAENGLHLSFWELFSDLPDSDRRGNVMSLENTFCEFSKYHRAAKGYGRPKNKYRPSEEGLPGDTSFKPGTIGLFELV